MKTLLILCALALAGCATRTIVMPDGTKIQSATLFVNSGLDKLDIHDSKSMGSSFKANGLKNDENSANDMLLQVVLALAARGPVVSPVPLSPVATAPLIVAEPPAVLPPPTTTVTTMPAVVETRVTVTPTK